MSEQALLATLKPAPQSLEAIYDLEDALTEAIENDQLGEVDGHEVALDGTSATIYMYSQDVRQMYETVRELFAKLDPCIQISFHARLGDVEDLAAPEVDFHLGEQPGWP